MKLIFRFITKCVCCCSRTQSKIILFLTGVYLSLLMNDAMADTDLLAEPTKDLFRTFAGSGINLLILIEICAGIYLFSTSRKIAAFVGIPLILGITAWAKVKFGGAA